MQHRCKYAQPLIAESSVSIPHLCPISPLYVPILYSLCPQLYPLCTHFVASFTAIQLRKCTQTVVVEHKECATRPPKMARKFRFHAGLRCATRNVFCAAFALHPKDSEESSKTPSSIEFAYLAAAHNRAARDAGQPTTSAFMKKAAADAARVPRRDREVVAHVPA